MRNNVFETMSSLQSHVLNFYIQTFKSQVATLLGSLDILGNPVGLIQDFTSGMEGLLKKGNVGGLLMNVAHGMSDSAAKVMFSLRTLLFNDTFTHSCTPLPNYHAIKMEENSQTFRTSLGHVSANIRKADNSQILS